jgi:virginiamycin B lyase
VISIANTSVIHHSSSSERLRNNNKIAKITRNGVLFAEYSLPLPNSRLWGITLGPDGALWYVEVNGERVGRLDAYPYFTYMPLVRK